MSTIDEHQAIKIASSADAVRTSRRIPAQSDGRSIERFLVKNRAGLAHALMDSLIEWDKDAGLQRDAQSLDVVPYEPSADYFALFHGSGEVIYRQLLIGELLKAVHAPDLTPEVQQEKRDQVLASYRARVSDLAEKSLDPEAHETLLAELDGIIRTATMPAEKTLKILFVGDCLTLDIVTFLAGPCREDRIDLNPLFLTSYNPLENRKAILDLPRDGFSLVFYSPFSYTFTADYSQTLASVDVLAGAEKVRRMIAPGFDEVRANIDLISNHFACPVIVHNSANVRRHDSRPLDRVKAALSSKARSIARREANWFLEQYVKNLGPSARVSILDEHSLLARHSEWELGRRFYNSIPTHPTVLSRHIAALYLDYVGVTANLMTRKLVVCDLDNTLWEGEIGEGKVTHFADRQATLKRLRNKGILLAINSKNDPKNVHWTGSELNERDFVASRINWNPKSENIREIRDTLNLKTKDFIFIDDRPDQRELVSAIFPEILSLDATDERSWRLLDLWSRLLPEQDDLDRTQLYHERAEREGFIAVESETADPTAMLARLGLRATLRLAKPADLKRAAELINRTNQFNLTGSRTSLPELKDWVASPDRSIFLVDGADKFGQMGVVCVALAERVGRDVKIPMFVLSCRVFGYGFEAAILNAIAKMARRNVPTGSRVVGLYRETPLNEPCRSMYPSQGYAWDGESWVLDPVEIKDEPSWIEIDDQTGA